MGQANLEQADMEQANRVGVNTHGDMVASVQNTNGDMVALVQKYQRRHGRLGPKN